MVGNFHTNGKYHTHKTHTKTNKKEMQDVNQIHTEQNGLQFLDNIFLNLSPL